MFYTNKLVSKFSSREIYVRKQPESNTTDLLMCSSGNGEKQNVTKKINKRGQCSVFVDERLENMLGNM